MRKEPFDKNEEPTRDEENLGNKSFAGATTTDREKQRLETVEANGLAQDEQTSRNHPSVDEKSWNEEVDQGAVRSAAFSPIEKDSSAQGQGQDKDQKEVPLSPPQKND